jgi:hypothetical protein
MICEETLPKKGSRVKAQEREKWNPRDLKFEEGEKLASPWMIMVF